MGGVGDQKTATQRNPGIGHLRERIDLQIMLGSLVTLVLFSPAQAAVFNIPAGDVAALIDAINTANTNKRGQQDKSAKICPISRLRFPRSSRS